MPGPSPEHRFLSPGKTATNGSPAAGADCRRRVHRGEAPGAQYKKATGSQGEGSTRARAGVRPQMSNSEQRDTGEEEDVADDSAAGPPGAAVQEREVEVAGPQGVAAAHAACAPVCTRPLPRSRTPRSARSHVSASPLGSRSPHTSQASATTSRSTRSCSCVGAV